MTELSSQFEQAFIGFDAAVAEETFTGADELDQGAREPALAFVIIKVGAMYELGRLVGQDLGDGGMRVAESIDRDPAAKIEVTFAGDIINVAARSVAEDDIEAAIAGNDVLEKSLDGGDVIANDRRWRGQDFFHWLRNGFAAEC